MDQLQLKSSTRKTFSMVGFAFLAFCGASVVGSLLLAFCLSPFLPESVTSASWYMWVETFVPTYLFAFPAAIFLLTRLPKQEPQVNSLTFTQFLPLIPICFFFMYSGNLLGQLLSSLISGGTAVNSLDQYAMDWHPFKILVMVIAAPVLEEYLCRKLLLDRIGVYGEKLAVLMSGLLFGLLHQNLFQFFYAFALGSVFAYVYLRTGKVRYTMILHCLINFLGAVVGPAVVQLVEKVLPGMEIEAEAILEPTALAALMGMMIYVVLLLGLAIVGLILLICNWKKLQWHPAELQLPRKESLSAAFVNVGMIIYILLCLVLTVLVCLV